MDRMTRTEQIIRSNTLSFSFKQIIDTNLRKWTVESNIDSDVAFIIVVEIKAINTRNIFECFIVVD